MKKIRQMVCFVLVLTLLGLVSMPQIQAAAVPAKIGVISIITGQGAGYGEAITNGLKMARDELNAFVSNHTSSGSLCRVRRYRHHLAAISDKPLPVGRKCMGKHQRGLSRS